MTYPSQPQQYAPQGYAPQQYQPQAYAPAPTQPQFPYGIDPRTGQPVAPNLSVTTPPMGGQTLPTQAPTLGQSGRTGGGATAPAPRHLVGRTVIFEPIRIDETTTAKDNAGNQVQRPTAYYHLTVVDGGPLQYGDNRDHDISKQHGMTFEVQTPCRFTSVSSDRFGIVNEVRDAIARGDVASVGVIVQGTQGNRPFLVTKPGRDLDGKDRPDGDARFAAAMDVWNKIWNKDLSWNPAPRSLVAPPSQAPQQVSYQPTPQQQGYAYAQPTVPQQPTYMPAAEPTTYNPQQYAAAPMPYAPQPTEYAMPDGQPVTVMQNGYAAPGPQQQSAPPANPAFEAWLATLPPEQRAAMQQPVGTPNPGNPGF